MLDKLSLRKLSVQSTDGKYYTLSPVNILDRAHLFNNLETIQNYLSNLSEEQRKKSISDIYDADEYFQHICCEALRSGGVDPGKVSMDVLYCLLFPFYDEDTKEFYDQGLLVSLNFSPKIFNVTNKEAEESSAAAETLSEMLGGLWASTNSITEAMEMISNLPADELIEVLNRRAEIQKDMNKTPEEKAKEEGKKSRKKYEELMEQRRQRLAKHRKNNSENDKNK